MTSATTARATSGCSDCSRRARGAVRHRPLPPGTLVGHRYRLVRKIGEGARGVVYERR